MADKDTEELSEFGNGESVSDGDELNLENELKDKFVIPGGWWGVVIVLTPIVGISVFLISITGWKSIVISIAMVAGAWVLKGLDWGVHMLMNKRRKKHVQKEESEKEKEVEEIQSTSVSESPSGTESLTATESPSVTETV
jgi:hypothetical protein